VYVVAGAAYDVVGAYVAGAYEVVGANVDVGA
jgi:hypothetical protein